MSRIVYYVEGETELAFVHSLKNELCLIRPGRAKVLNIVNQPISNFIRRQFKMDEIAVFIFDTDAIETRTLESNIKILEQEKRNKHIKDFFFIMQVPNLEGEIMRSCSLKRIRDFFGDRNDSDFKSNMTKSKTLKVALERNNFNIDVLWSIPPLNEFSKYESQPKRIKSKK